MQRHILRDRLFCLLMAAVLLFAAFPPHNALAEAAAEEIAMDASPFISDDRTYVPVRYATEPFGIDVSWIGVENAVVFSYGDTSLRISVGSNLLYLTKDGKTETISMDVEPTNVNSRVYIPIRWVLEPFDASVNWVEFDRSVVIQLNEKTLQFNVGSNVAILKDESADMDPKPSETEPSDNENAKALKDAFTEITSQEPDKNMLESWLAKGYTVDSEEFAEAILQWLEDNEDKFTAEYIWETTVKAYTHVKGKAPIVVEEVKEWTEETGFPALVNVKDAVIDFGTWFWEGLKEAQRLKYISTAFIELYNREPTAEESEHWYAHQCWKNAEELMLVMKDGCDCKL